MKSQRVLLNRLNAFVMICAAALLLLNCSAQLAPAYDDQTDSGLSQINTDVTAFVNKMIDEAGTPRGTWSSNKEFYSTEEAKVDTLIVRAEAHKALNSCPSTAAITDALRVTVPKVTDAQRYISQLPQNDCLVVLLTLLKQAMVDLETFHKAQGDKGIPESAHDPILVGGLGSLIHSAITVEVALKSGQSITAAGGR